MKTTSRTKNSKPVGRAKRPGNLDRAALTHAYALIADRPTMKPKAALRKAGVTSSKKIERLSDIMSERPAARLLSKEEKSAASSPISEHAESALDHDLFKRFETAMKRFESLPRHTEAVANFDTALGIKRETQPSLWYKMFRWSPYGLMLWQVAAMTDAFAQSTKSSRTL